MSERDGMIEIQTTDESVPDDTMGERPRLLPPDLEMIPDDLRKHDQWVVWEAVWEEDASVPEGGRWCKIPFHATSGGHASSSDRATWSRYEVAAAAYRDDPKRYAGVGFMLDPDDPFTVVIIEGAIADDNTLLPEATRVLGILRSYAERDPGGRGLRILTRANLPPGGRRRGALEMHESDGFLPITGLHWEGSPMKVQKRQPEIEAMHADVFPPPLPQKGDKEPRISPFAHSPASVLDKDLLALAFHTANGPRIESLYTGKTNGINGDRNAADLALCSMLGFYTGDDPMRLDRLFRSSALFRQKWDLPHYSDGRTYGQATVAKALEGCIVFYTPPSSRNDSPQSARPLPTPVASQSAATVERKNGASSANGHAKRHKNTVSETSESTEDKAVNSRSDSEDDLEETATPELGVATVSASIPIDRHIAQSLAPFAVAEAQGRAQGLAINERVLTAQEAAKLLRVSVRLLRETVKPWRRFGAAVSGDRWLLSDLLARDEG